jgi:excinuclease ABC subunit C
LEGAADLSRLLSHQAGRKVDLVTPQRGAKADLIRMAQENAKTECERLTTRAERTAKVLTLLAELLGLPEPPGRIEAYDISNTGASDIVAAMTVFEEGKPKKGAYRYFKLRDLTGPDDYASMKEVVKRRYQRAIEEKAPLPDLLITDGGKGQMSAVKEVIDELGLNIPIAGLAKDGKHRTSELLYGYPPQTIGLKQNTPLFRLLTQIQDEVHRFAITFHRDKRSKRQIASALDEIKGIGEKTKSTLLKEFKSVKRIREASAEELAAVVGEAKAKIIQTYFSEK